VRAVRRAWRRLGLGWPAGLQRLPFFTQRTAVLLLGVLVAALAMLGGAVALVGWPGANGPTHLVPGERAGQRPESRPRDLARPLPGAAGRTADHPSRLHHNDHRPPGPPRPGQRPPRPGRLHPAALIKAGC
jgi:hypothetical protein